MARRCKSLPKPEQGYQHREHRSKKGRTPDYWSRKKSRVVAARARKSQRRPDPWRMIATQ